MGPPSLSAATSHLSSLPQLPLSAPPTGMDECFFLNSSVVGLPYSSIFWQFWVFLYWLLSFFWLCKEVKHIYLHLHLGQKSPKWNYFKYSSVIPVLAFFLFLNLLLSFFWLCKEAKCIYLHLHLGQKSWFYVFWTQYVSILWIVPCFGSAHSSIASWKKIYRISPFTYSFIQFHWILIKNSKKKTYFLSVGHYSGHLRLIKKYPGSLHLRTLHSSRDSLMTKINIMNKWIT